MSSIDINKLIQESISNRPVNENGNDPEAGLENALVGVEEAGIPGYLTKGSGVIPSYLTKGSGAAAKGAEGVRKAGQFGKLDDAIQTMDAKGSVSRDLLGKTYGRLGSAVKAPFKDQTPKPTQGPLKGTGGAWDAVKDAASNPKVQMGAAIGAGALGAGYAAKKYLQRRKAKKSGR